MYLKLNTVKFNEMLSRALKGAGRNKMIPLTSMIGITLGDNHTLLLHTTDMSNHLYVSMEDVEGDAFNITVDIDILSKLLPRITSEYVTLSVNDDNVLRIIGNGDYKIELELDDDGDLIHFPDPDGFYPNHLDYDWEEYEIYSSNINTMLMTNKLALAGTDEPVYSNYYIGDKVITTNRDVVCSYDAELFKNKALLLSPQLVDLLSIITDDTIKVKIKDNIAMFITDDVIVYGILSEGIEDYDVELIEQFIETEFDMYCELPKQALISTLERISLFINDFDDRAIRLYFKENELEISSKQSSGIENIKYLDSNDISDYECNIDVDILLQQIKTVAGDKVVLEFGNDTCVKIDDDDVIKIISTKVE